LIGLEKQFNEVKYALASDGIVSNLPDKWMIMLDLSFIIGQRYIHVVVPLSNKKGLSETLFPLYGAPSHRNQMMCLTHVNDNHFTIVYLKDGCPISVIYVL